MEPWRAVEVAALERSLSQPFCLLETPGTPAFAVLCAGLGLGLVLCPGFPASPAAPYACDVGPCSPGETQEKHLASARLTPGR